MPKILKNTIPEITDLLRFWPMLVFMAGKLAVRLREDL
jgi:hypothetical protein